MASTKHQRKRRAGGRPRRVSVERRPDGKPRNAVDGAPDAPTTTPTPEQQTKRAQLAAGGDPTYTSCLLDLMRTREIISWAQHAAGVRYSFLYRTVYGRPKVSAGGYDERVDEKGVRSTAIDPVQEEKAVDCKAKLRDADRHLGGRDYIIDLVIHDCAPGSLDADALVGRGAYTEKLQVLDDLTSLARVFGYKRDTGSSTRFAGERPGPAQIAA